MVQMMSGVRQMAGIQRFVTYIYAYENGEKTSNTGYAKLEIRGSNGRMEIHFSGDSATGRLGKVFFLYPDNGELKELSVGDIQLDNGQGKGQYAFLAEAMPGTKLSFEKMAGLQIADEMGRKYMSFWKDIDIPKTGEESAEREAVEEIKESSESVLQQIKLENNEEMEEAEQKSLHTMEIPMRNVFPEDSIENSWKNFLRYKECVQINDAVCGIQIELSDLRELPKRYWYMGNNSFLLHGFFNYRHLLFGRLEDGNWFLGVPGVYERPEKVMASIFGFSGFMPIGKAEQITPREKQQGVWYHILES